MIAEELTRSRRLPLPRFSARLMLILASLVLVLGVGWLWFRDSSLVAIRTVRVTGVSGPDAGQIRRSLDAAALHMTTLDVDMNRLEIAVETYPFVRSISVSTGFPHSAVIDVLEQVPVATVRVGGRVIPVDGAGTLLTYAAARRSGLPEIPLRTPPGGSRLTASGARAAARVLGAAPYALLPHIALATFSATHGVIVQMRNGPQIYFGGASELAAKWVAAVAVLGDSSSQGAQYIDVTDPFQAAAGAAQPSPAGTSSTSSTSSTGSDATGTGVTGGEPSGADTTDGGAGGTSTLASNPGD